MPRISLTAQDVDQQAREQREHHVHRDVLVRQEPADKVLVGQRIVGGNEIALGRPLDDLEAVAGARHQQRKRGGGQQDHAEGAEKQQDQRNHQRPGQTTDAQQYRPVERQQEELLDALPERLRRLLSAIFVSGFHPRVDRLRKSRSVPAAEPPKPHAFGRKTTAFPFRRRAAATSSGAFRPARPPSRAPARRPSAPGCRPSRC